MTSTSPNQLCRSRYRAAGGPPGRPASPPSIRGHELNSGFGRFKRYRQNGSRSGGARGARRGSRDPWGTTTDWLPWGRFTINVCARARALKSAHFFQLYEPWLNSCLGTTPLYPTLVIDAPARLVIQGTSLSIFSSSACVLISLVPCFPNLFPIPAVVLKSSLHIFRAAPLHEFITGNAGNSRCQQHATQLCSKIERKSVLGLENNDFGMRIHHLSGSFLKLSLASLKIQVKLRQLAALVSLLLQMGTYLTVSRQNALWRRDLGLNYSLV